MPAKKPAAERKSHRIVIPVTKDEHRKVKADAGKAGITTYARKLFGLPRD